MVPDRMTGPRRRLKPPPDYLSRSVQRQLLMLFGLLGLVLVLMKVAAQPENWAWMWRQTEGQATAEPGPGAADVGAPSPPGRARPPMVADSFVSPAATESAAESGLDERSPLDFAGGVDGALLDSVRDDTYFRAAEREAWFHLLAWLQASPQGELEAEVQGSVSSLQLLGQMPAYRGRLVRVQGVVRRANPVSVPNNDAGVHSYWQCWLQDATGTAPIVIYALQMPAEFPRGQELQEPAEFVGVAFKRWAYQAESGLLVAPVLLAKTARWAPQPRPPARRPVTVAQVLLGTITVALLAWLVVRFVYKSSVRSTPRSRGTDRPSRLDLLVLLGVLSLLPTQRAWGQPAVDGLRETLRLYKLDESRWRSLIDGRPLAGEETEILYRVLYVLPRLDVLDVWRWQQVPTAWSDLVERPEDARGRLLEVRGEVIGLQQIDLPAESARRFDYAKFYQVTLRSSADLRPRVVYAREVPKRWQDQPPASEEAKSASCSGLFLKTGEGRSGEEALLFATARVAWHPTGTDPSAGVNEGMSLLGSVGMDVSLLSDVVQGKPLGYEDRECFYQMLWAVSRLDPAGIPPAVASPPDIQRLLRQPDACAGELMTVSGNVRRALRIEVTDADVQQRFGIDHYYEMELFLPLQQPLTLIDPWDGESRSYQTFPITVCVRQLPPELSQGPEIHHHVQVTGFYMKLWSYRSRFMEGPADDPTKDAARRRQISPLLIGVRVRSIERAAPRRRGFGWILASGFLAALILIGLVARWFRHSDRAFNEWKRRATHPPPDSVPMRGQEPRSREPPQ